MTENKALELQFADECKVIELKYEYTDYTGYERYGIITALTEKELSEKYGSLLDTYKPFAVLPPAFAEVREDFIKNEWKHEKRSKRGLSYGIDDEDFEAHHQECAAPDCLEMLIVNERNDQLWAAIDKLSRTQKKYVIAYFFQGKNGREIALEEGVDPRSVLRSIDRALKKLKEFL